MEKTTTNIRNLMFLIMMTVTSSAWAQEDTIEYYPQGTTWEEAWYVKDLEDITKCLYWYQRSTVDGDTVINGIEYKRVIVEVRQLDNPSDFVDWYNTGSWHWEFYNSYGIREEGGIVYMIRKYYSEEIMVYDFNWEIGKKLTYLEFDGLDGEFDDYYTYTIDSINQYVFADGTIGSCLIDERGLWMIQGIGDVRGIFEMVGYYLFHWGPQFARLINFTRNGTLLYEWDVDAYLEAYYAYLEGLGVRQLPREIIKPSGTYTLSGMRMSDDAGLPPGIYIRNGRKVVVR